MRTFPAAVRTQMEAPETEEVFLVLLTIEGPGYLGRFVNNNQDVTSSGRTFLAYPFDIALPVEDDERQPEATIRIDNVAGEILDAIRALDDAPYVTIELVRAAAPDAALITVNMLRLRSIEVSAAVIQGRLAIDNVLFQQYPAGQYTPAEWPGLFA